MRSRLVVSAIVGALGVSALSGIATAAPAGLALVGLLNGQEEVNASGTPNNGDLAAAGFIVATVDGDKRQVCVTEFKTGGLAGTTLAFHIHKAPAGQNGDIVVNFTPLLPSGIGCVPVDDRRLLSDIKRSASKFYFNVHTTSFQGGAIRGQIRHLARR